MIFGQLQFLRSYHIFTIAVHLTVRSLLSLISLFCVQLSFAQTLGGNAVFNFLKLSNTPQLTGLGSVNVSQTSPDIGLAFNNPALLSTDMHTQVNAVFNSFYDGVTAGHLSTGFYSDRLKTNLLWGVNYINYGSTVQTDAAGNILGRFRAADWVMQVAASRTYMERWSYGLTLKFISSSYGSYSANGIAADVGVMYHDSASLFSASVLVKNIGTQLKKYEGTEGEDLPFDLQAGITRRFQHAPFSISLTAQRMHQLNIRYDDTLFNNDNGFANASDKKITAGKLLDHLVLGSTIYIGDRVEVYAGYNFLRRRELNIGNGGNGLNGFSLGAGFLLGKLQVRYARSYYQGNRAFNQFGIGFTLNQYFNLGKTGN